MSGSDTFNWDITVREGGVTAVHLLGDYSLTTDIGNLFGLVRDGRTYIGVHTGGATQPAIRVILTQIQFEDWSDHTCTT